MAQNGFGRRGLMERGLLAGAAFGAGALALPAIGRAQAQGAVKDITIQIWGTTWTGSVHKVAAAFEKATGIHVTPVTQATSGEGLVKLQAMRAAPTIDVWFTTSSVAERAKSDTQLFKPVEMSALSNSATLIKGAHGSHWVAVYYYPLGIVWRTDMVKQPITSWQELWEPRFKNMLGIPTMNSYQGQVLGVAAMINGGSLTNVDPGFAALKRLKPNVVTWYNSDTTARQALAQGEFGVLVAPPSGLKRVLDAGVAAKMISPPPAPMMYDAMMLVNTPKQEAALKFIDFCLGKESQDIIAQGQGMAPVNTQSVPSPDIVEGLPKPGDGVSFDDNIINANIAAWNERFNRDIAS